MKLSITQIWSPSDGRNYTQVMTVHFTVSSTRNTHVSKKEKKKKMEILCWKSTIIMSCLKNKITAEGMSMEHRKLGCMGNSSMACTRTKCPALSPTRLQSISCVQSDFFLLAEIRGRSCMSM